MLNTREIAAQNGGQTDKLKIGPKAYAGRTIEEMCDDVIERIQATIVHLEAFEELDDDEPFVAPMAKEVRHGFRVKIGYGAKNEKLEGIEPMNFWTAENAIGYLNDVCHMFENGEGDQVLAAKRQVYADRAQKARDARRKQPLVVAA